MKALVGVFKEEKALEGAFSVIRNLRMDLFQALVITASEMMLSVSVFQT